MDGSKHPRSPRRRPIWSWLVLPGGLLLPLTAPVWGSDGPPAGDSLISLQGVVTTTALVCSCLLVLAILKLGRLNRRLRQECQLRQTMTLELLESERHFRFIAENSADVIWTMDIASGRFTYVSPSVTRLRGYTVDEVMSQSLDELMTRESAARVQAVLAETLTGWEAGEGQNTKRVTEVDQPHKDGRLIHTEVVTTLHADDQGRPVSILGVTRDITERKQAEAQIRRQAFYDALTQLPNRRLLLDRLQQAVYKANRDQSRLALLFIDLDGFKPVNDRFGHQTGDWLLQQVASRMRSCIRRVDTVARLGGDEFVVLLPEVTDQHGAVMVAEKIRTVLGRPFEKPGGRVLTISTCIGVALYPEHGNNEKQLLKHGDAAMYLAKQAGRNQVRLYRPLPEWGENESTAMVRLVWQSAYECGEPEIDREHRMLLRLATELLNAGLTRDSQPERFTQSFDALLSETARHFDHEEAILARHNYPLLTGHRRVHQELLNRAIELHDLALTGNMQIGALVDYLINDVVMNHMLRQDREFAYLFQPDKLPQTMVS